MQWAVSDLAFGGFNKKYLSGLPLTYNIEFFYEFGTDHYWDTVLLPLAQNNKEKRTFSIHGPCVAVNLADSSDEYYLKCLRSNLYLCPKDQSRICSCAYQ